jgi:hypothetical protein
LTGDDKTEKDLDMVDIHHSSSESKEKDEIEKLLMSASINMNTSTIFAWWYRLWSAICQMHQRIVASAPFFSIQPLKPHPFSKKKDLSSRSTI